MHEQKYTLVQLRSTHDKIQQIHLYTCQAIYVTTQYRSTKSIEFDMSSTFIIRQLSDVIRYFCSHISNFSGWGYTGGFQSMGVAPDHPFYFRIFHYKPSVYIYIYY